MGMMRLALGFPLSPVHSSTAIARTEGAAFLLLSRRPGYCPLAGAASAYAYRVEVAATRPITDYTARAIPNCDGVAVPLEAAQIQWQR